SSNISLGEKNKSELYVAINMLSVMINLKEVRQMNKYNNKPFNGRILENFPEKSKKISQIIYSHLKKI
ncbi:hypothetical protein ACLI10_16825, partial [Enterococcus faecalis]|uniref:hypothetical protein n=1 Tax=Enterococcus faecalis TaxID=1351 RepID=UPI003984CBDF